MNKLLAVLLAGFLSTVSFAASHAGAPMMRDKPVEAMKAGDPKAQAAAQAKVDGRPQVGDPSAEQPEAMKAGSEKAKAAGERKKNARPDIATKKSSGERMKKDAAKL